VHQTRSPSKIILSKAGVHPHGVGARL